MHRISDFVKWINAKNSSCIKKDIYLPYMCRECFTHRDCEQREKGGTGEEKKNLKLAAYHYLLIPPCFSGLVFDKRLLY